MKNIYSSFILLISFSVFFVSCSSDSTSELSFDKSAITKDNRVGMILGFENDDFMPSNINNPYDSAGRIHDALFELYYASDSLPSSISEIAIRVENLASKTPEFNLLKGIDYQEVSPSNISYIIAESSSDLAHVINNSGMTTLAKTSLLNFVNELLSLSETEASSESIYNFVVPYEDAVFNNTQLTENDKKIILTTSSIARYSTFRDAKRPKKNNDPDWDIFVGHIMGGTNGAIDGEAEALMKALVTGIVQNQ